MKPFVYHDQVRGVVYDINELTDLNAVAITGWEYESPYDLYNMYMSPLAIVEFMRGPYYSVYRDHNLCGFFCYGAPARAKAPTSDIYYKDTSYLDIGLGLHPDLCGQGYGVGFVQAGLEFARARFGIKRFRLTVADFNKRAHKVYSRAGFRDAGRFTREGATGPMEFIVMIYDPNKTVTP